MQKPQRFLTENRLGSLLRCLLKQRELPLPVAVTPVCPHFLSTRPIVFSGGAEFTASSAGVGEWYLTVDGKESYTLGEGDRVVITRSGYTTKLIDLKKNAFYQVMRKRTSETQK